MANKNDLNIFRVFIICACWSHWSNNVHSESAEKQIIQHRVYNVRDRSHWRSDVTTSAIANDVNDVSQLVDTSQNNVEIRQQLVIERNDLSRQAQIDSINVSEENETKAVASNSGSRRHKREQNERNLCKSVCNCELNKNFLSADCAFQQQFAVLKPSLFFPNSTTLVHIRLSQSSGLRIDENMFATNRINRISISGTHPHGEEHLEISSKAFHGNNGPFPEIEIKNVHTVLIQANAFYREFQLNIVDCHKVVIFGEAFRDTKFNGYFDKIPNLMIFEKAFTHSDAKIHINNCTIEQLQRLEAPLKEIKFTNARIAEIATGAFDVLSINSIIFENCVLGRIQKRALSEKLLSNHFAIIGSEIDVIESGAISGSGIADFIFTNNSINKIQDKAISLTTVNVQITNNTINFLEWHWIRIEDWSNVTVAHNRFGEYNQMMVERTSKYNKCLFENNFITKPKLGSLNFKSPRCRIKEIAFKEPCTCNSSLFKQLAFSDYRANYYCTIEPTLVHCFNATLLNVLDYERNICDDSTKIDCLSTNVNIKRNGSFINLNEIIKNSKKLFYMCAVAGFLVALILVIIICYSIRCYMRKDVVNTPAQDLMIMASLHPLTPSPKKANAAAVATTIGASAPDSMFSNSDLLIIRESLDRLKQRYPSEIYDQVHNNTRKLIVGGLVEAERVGIIGEIVKSLVDCQGMGTDLVAFTNILYNHLGPSPDERIYFEPDEQVCNNAVGNGLYAISGGSQQHPDDGLHRTADHANDPIYAEPNLQLPLLKNEYMQPADRTDAENTPLYSEPVFDSSAKGRIISPPMHNINNDVNVTYSQVNKHAVPSTSKQIFSDYHPHQRQQQQQQQQQQKPQQQQPKTNTSHKKQRTKLADQQYHDSNSSSESNSCSEHSGGSGDTLQIDDIYNIDNLQRK